MPQSQSSSSLLGKIATYTEILSHDPHSTVFVPLSEAYRQMGLIDDAYEIALKGVDALPHFSPGYITLGRIEAQKGLMEQSIASFNKALSIEPENIEALRGLARVSMLHGNNEVAYEALNKAHVIDPDDTTTNKMMASLGVKKIDHSGAIKQPPMPSAESAGRTEEKPAKGIEPISTATIAEIYIKQGFLRRALKVYRDILRTHPQNEDIRQKLVVLKQRIIEEEGGSLHETVSSLPSTENDNSVKEDMAPEVSSVATGVSENSHDNEILTKLNGWLESVQRRKPNVR